MGVELSKEAKRKVIHIGMGLWMFYPLILSRTPAMMVVLLMLFLALFVFRPHAWTSSFEFMARMEDYSYTYLIGPLVYICAIGICVAFYPLFISAAAIGIMAFGDGFATLIGKRYGKTYSPLNKNKTIEGSISFVVFAFIATTIAMYFTAPLDSIFDVMRLTSIGAITGAIVEMPAFENYRGNNIFQRVVVDDNFFVPILSGLAMYLAYITFF